MSDDALVKLIQKAVKDEVRPLKENLEVIKNKVSQVELFQNVSSGQVRAIRDQQSVINEKLDGIEVIKQDLDTVKESLGAVQQDLALVQKDLGLVQKDVGTVKKDVEVVKDQLNDLNEITGNRMYPSVVEIENKITAYADMYKINDNNARKLEKRVIVLEDNLQIKPSTELLLADIS